MGRKTARVAGLLTLAISLYAGDRAEYDGDIWVGDEHALDVRRVSTGRSPALPAIGDFGVATYNLKYGKQDKDAVVRNARSLGAAVLGLTETGSNLAQEIAGNNYNVIHGFSGNALLTRFPVRKHFSEKLPREEGKMLRTALFAQLDVGDRDVWFVLTHLSHDEWPDSSENIRMEQLATLEEIIDERLGGEAIILGDFNFEPDTAGYRFMDEHYNDGLAELGIGNTTTFRGGLGLKRLDYMFIDESLDFEVVAGGRRGLDGSDHLPIMMVLAYNDHHTNSLPTVLE